MNDQNSISSSASLFDYLKAIVIVSVIATVVNLAYYHLWQSLSGIPVPNPYTSTHIIIQTVFVMVISGIVHIGYRKKREKSSFDYLSGLLILILINLTIFYVLMDVRRLPSINEIKRLFGDAGAPATLLWLSAPIALSSALFGIFMIPKLALKKVEGKKSESKIKEYRKIARKLLQSYAIVCVIILCVNTLYYTLYVYLGGKLPSNGFSISVMVQMALVLTAVAAMLYLYLRDNLKNGLAFYIMLTVIIAWSAFLAGLPRPNGQPMYDETLWLNIPLAVFSAIGELVGIPFFFKDLMKDKNSRKRNDHRRYSR
jgi:hypothetical protein